MDTLPESPNAFIAPPWWAPGLWAACAEVPKKGSKMGPLSQALLAFLSPPLGSHVVPEAFQKETQNDVEKGCQRSLKTGFPTKHGKCEFDMLFAMFQPCGAPSKRHRFSSFLGYQSGCPRRVFKKTPPKYVQGCSDSPLGASRVIFGVSSGVPIWSQNEVWECMPSPLVSRGGPKTVLDGPR